MTIRTIRSGGDRVQFASPAAERDQKVGRAAHALWRAGYSTTAAGAIRKLERRIADVVTAADVLAMHGHLDTLHRLLGPVDRRRIGAVAVRLCAGAMLTIQRRDGDDDISRWRWFETRAVEDGKAAIRDANRMIESLHELVAGIITEHPELAP